MQGVYRALQYTESTEALLLLQCHMGSLFTRKYILHLHNMSTALFRLISTRIPSAQQHYMQVSHTEVYSHRAINDG